MKNRRPIIPRLAREKVEKRHANGLRQVATYYLDRKLVGHRSWDEQGNITVEYAIRNDLKHGPFTRYYSDGAIWATQFVGGKEHGISRQYDQKGKLFGWYRMNHGTGVDLWYTAAGELSEE